MDLFFGLIISGLSFQWIISEMKNDYIMEKYGERKNDELFSLIKCLISSILFINHINHDFNQSIYINTTPYCVVLVVVLYV